MELAQRTGAATGGEEVSRVRAPRPALDFAGLAALAGAGAVLVPGPWRALPALLAASWLGMVAVFLCGAPRALGKRADGRRASWAVLLWWPYFAYAIGLRALKRALGVDPVPWHEVAPGIWLGRSPFRGERAPEVDVAVDVAAEIATPAQCLAPARYVSLPTLNKRAPGPDALLAVARELAGAERRAFVFCGAGKGRSATVVAAILLARRLAATPEEAEAWLRDVRPGVRLHPPQRQALRQLSSRLSGGFPPPVSPPTTAAGS